MWLGRIKTHATAVLICLVIVFGLVATVLWRSAAADADRRKRQLDNAQASMQQEIQKMRDQDDQMRAETLRQTARAATLENQLGQAQEDIRRLRAELNAATQPQNQPPATFAGRQLTQNQHDTLVHDLQGNGAPVVVAVSEDSEARAYGAQLAAALNDAGFAVTTAEYNFKPREAGVTLAEIPNMEQDVSALATAFRDAKIAFRRGQPSWSNGMAATMKLEIRVGSAPDPDAR